MEPATPWALQQHKIQFTNILQGKAHLDFLHLVTSHEVQELVLPIEAPTEGLHHIGVNPVAEFRNHGMKSLVLLRKQ